MPKKYLSCVPDVHRTLELTCVCLQVRVECTEYGEPLVTLCTLELTCVCLQVRVERTEHGEPLVTLRTVERPLACVCPHMTLEVILF